MASIKNIFSTEYTNEERREKQLASSLYVAFPAIVNTINANGTVNVQPAIRERVVDADNVIRYQDYPIIPNVPVVFPSTNSAFISMPISYGDECLVVITDQSFDNWWLYGGLQNPIEQRRHNLTDAFAIFGIRNNTHPLPFSSTLKLYGPNGSIIDLGAEKVSVTYGQKERVTINETGTILTYGEDVSVNLNASGINLAFGIDSILTVNSDGINVVVGGKKVLEINSEGIKITGKILNEEEVDLASHIHKTGDISSGGPIDES